MLKFVSCGKDSCVAGTGLDFALPEKGDFLFAFLSVPSDEEIERVAAGLNLDKKFFSSFSHASRSTKYSDEPLVFSFVDYFVEHADLKHSRLLFALSDNFLVIVSAVDYAYYNELYDKLVLRLNGLPRKKLSAFFLLHEFLEEDVEDNFAVMEYYDNKIAKLEEDVADFNKADPQRLKEIIALKRDLSKLSRRFWSSVKLFSSIKRHKDGKTYAMMDDLHDAYLHQIELVSTQKEMLSDMLAVFETSFSNRLAVISNDLNTVMKKLTAVTVIIMLPTLVASIYGMNFANIPELKADYGFYEALAAMAVLAFGLYYYFHKKEWI